MTSRPTRDLRGEIRAFILHSCTEKKTPPTLREICAHTEKALAAVRRLVHDMSESGEIGLQARGKKSTIRCGYACSGRPLLEVAARFVSVGGCLLPSQAQTPPLFSFPSSWAGVFAPQALCAAVVLDDALVAHQLARGDRLLLAELNLALPAPRYAGMLAFVPSEGGQLALARLSADVRQRRSRLYLVLGMIRRP